MSLIVDKLVHRNANLRLCGHKLRDAIVFKVEDVPITMKEIVRAQKPFLKWMNDVSANKNDIWSHSYDNPHEMKKGEQGKTKFWLARLPYENILFYMKFPRVEVSPWGEHWVAIDQAGWHNIIWIVKTGTDDNKYSISLYPQETESIRMDFYLESDGYVDWGDTFMKSFFGDLMPHDPAVKLQYLTILHIVLKLCSIINCKNIEIKEINPDSKHQKARIRKGKPPLISYKTLRIKQSNRLNRYNGAGVNQNRIHLCRGHFKNYTKEKPLMGKHTGLYWWEPCVRGNKEKGMVVKDYEIQA